MPQTEAGAHRERRLAGKSLAASLGPIPQIIGGVGPNSRFYQCFAAGWRCFEISEESSIDGMKVGIKLILAACS